MRYPHASFFRRGSIGLPTKHYVRIQINRRRRYVVEAEEPLTEAGRASDSVSNTAGESAMNAPTAVELYRKQQEELERQRREDERLTGFDFTRMLLQKLGLRAK